MNRSVALRSFVADILKAIESFPEKDSNAKQVFNQLASSDPALFFAAGIRVVATSKPSEAVRYLILILAKDRRLSIGLLDSTVCTIVEAVAVARAAVEAGSQLQSTFEMGLNKALQGQASPPKAERILRILEILAVVSDQNCWSSFQVELMAYPDKMVRAKAALLIGRSTRNVGWIARRLLDRDLRVQASAVEALWGMNAEEVKPHFVSALKSGDNRVAANAALGLYISGDATAMRILLEMLRHSDPTFRLSALWAIGETRDERFLPALTEYYKRAEGKERLATVGAMSKIRRRERTAEQAGALQVHMSQAVAQADGVRRLAFALSCHPPRDLSGIKPTDCAIWENGTIIDEYQVRLATPPAILMAGFVAPWFASGDEGYEKAVREALQQCLHMKRRDDLWRIDRYSIEINPPTAEKTPPEFIMPYDDSLITPELKASQGCLSDRELLEKALTLISPRDRAAPDPIAAFQRQCDAFAKRGGKRHVFLFLHDMSGFDLQQEAAINRLRSIANDSSVVLHGIAPDIAGKWPLLREACLSNSEGSFAETTLEGMVDGLVDAYVNLFSRFEIVYSLPISAEAGPTLPQPPKVKLKISSERGFGESEITLDLPPPPPSAPNTVQTPAAEEVQPVS